MSGNQVKEFAFSFSYRERRNELLASEEEERY